MFLFANQVTTFQIILLDILAFHLLMVLVVHLFPQPKLLHSRFILLEKSLFKNTIYYFLIIVFRFSLRMPH